MRPVPPDSHMGPSLKQGRMRRGRSESSTGHADTMRSPAIGGVDSTTQKGQIMATKNTDAVIHINRIPRTTMIVPIKGVTPLIVHKFSEKAKRQILESQQGKKKLKEVRDPQAEYERCLYRMDLGDGKDHYGFPAVGFKACTVSGARFLNDKRASMTAIRQFVFVHGIITPADPQGLVEIKGGEPRLREDAVRLGGQSRSADVRYRAEFTEWSAELEVAFVPTSIDKESVLSLIDAGGQYVGVGEWRPERRGDFGRFEIDMGREVVMVGE